MVTVSDCFDPYAAGWRGRIPAMADAPPLPLEAAREGESTCRDIFLEFMTK